MTENTMERIASGVAALLSDRAYRNWLVEKTLARLRYDFEFWGRKACYEHWETFFSEKDVGTFNTLEISPGGNSRWERFGFRSYSGAQYPEFDICKMNTSDCYDVIIADNVFEHLRYPYSAARNVLDMLNPEGVFLMSTPFLVKVHKEPDDYTRWTEDGLKCFLEDSGFAEHRIQVASWGNRACVKANLKGWKYVGWGRRMVNEPDYPVTVWAIAQKE